MSARLLRADLALGEMRSIYQRQVGERAALARRHEATKAAHAEAKQDIADWELAVRLLAMVSEAAREQVRLRIEQTVTAALQTVFGEGIQFRVTLGLTGGQPSVEWQIVSRYADAEIATGVEDARGGGVVDVVSLALRLAVAELYRPRLGGPLVLDEPGKHLSAEYAMNLARFLKAYSQETGRQIILVTHLTQLAECADCSFRVVLRGGRSEVASG